MVKYQSVRCPRCNKKVAEHIIGMGWFTCRSCKTKFMVDRREERVKTLGVS